MRVREVMTEDPQTIRLGKRIRAAISMLACGKMRHLPVVDDEERFVGVVSRTDLLAGMPSTLDPAVSQADREACFGFVPIERIMRDEVVTVLPDADVADAARLMREHRISCLPVVRSGKLLGIVTSYDLLGVLVGDVDCAHR